VEGRRGNLGGGMEYWDCHAEFTLSHMKFFAEFILSEILQSLCSFRMTLTKGSE
jgi:hypothetical protein